MVNTTSATQRFTQALEANVATLKNTNQVQGYANAAQVLSKKVEATASAIKSLTTRMHDTEAAAGGATKAARAYNLAISDQQARLKTLYGALYFVDRQSANLVQAGALLGKAYGVSVPQAFAIAQ